MKCWNCGKNTMEEAPEIGQDWFQCTSCHATDVINPTTVSRFDTVAFEPLPGSKLKKYTPGKMLKLKTERAREKKN